MRYNVAVKALLKRLGKSNHLLTTEVPGSLARQLKTTTLRQCQRFASSWSIGSVHGAPAREDDIAHGEAVPPHLAHLAKWGAMEEHVPAMLLFLELSQDHIAPANCDESRQRLFATMLYNIPRPLYSPEIYALCRSLIIAILPDDLREMTSANLFAAFATLCSIKAIDEETRGIVSYHGGRVPDDQDWQKQRNYAIATIVQRLPPHLKKHFVIQDDTALLRRLCSEFVRRLPAAGDNFASDYVKTLITGNDGQSGVLTDYSFSTVQRTSSTHSVTREEFCVFLPKLIVAEVKAEKARENAMAVRQPGAPRAEERSLQATYYTESAAVAITNALTHLCLLQNVAEIMAARELCLGEWLFLISGGTAAEPRWSAAVLPALHTALRVADAQRVERCASQQAFGTTTDSLFGDMAEGRRAWLLRGYMGALFSMRTSSESLCCAINATLPLLSELARELRRSDNLTVDQMFEFYNAMQTLWVLMRLLWHCDAQQMEKQLNGDLIKSLAGQDAAAGHELEEDEEEEVALHDGEEHGFLPFRPAAARVQLSSTLQVDEFLKVGGIIIDAVKAAIDREGGFAVPSAAKPPASVEKTGESEPAAAPRRGSGFARTGQKLKALRSPFFPLSADLQSRREKKKRGLVQLTLDAYLTYCFVVMEDPHRSMEWLQEVKAQALRVLPIARDMAVPGLEMIRADVTQYMEIESKTDLDSHGVASSHHKRHLRGRAEVEGILPTQLRRDIDAFVHQRPAGLRVIQSLLQLEGEAALTAEERLLVIRYLTDATEDVCTLLHVLHKADYMHVRTERLVQGVLNCFMYYVQPFLITQADANTPAETLKVYQDNHQAMRKLVQTCQETVHHIWSSSTAFSLSALHAVQPGSPAAAAQFAAQMTLVRVMNLSMSCGAFAGLTSEEMPHLVSSLQRSFDTLAACAQRPRAGRAGASSKTGSNAVTSRQVKLLVMWAYNVQHLCTIGVFDSACLVAATEALRRCGTEEHIAAMTTRQRHRFLFHTTYCFRVLIASYAASYECRNLLHQILVVVARVTVERGASSQHSSSSRGGGAAHGDSSLATMVERCGNSVMIWQMLCSAVVNTMPTPAVDRSINALLQYVKRNLAVPAPPGYVAHTPDSFSHAAARLDHLEAVLGRLRSKDMNMLLARPPQTVDEYETLCCAVTKSFVDASKPCYRQILTGMHNSPTPSQRLRWQAHADVLATVVLRFQHQLPPTLWHRVLRESLDIHHILAFPNLHTPAMQEVLLLAMDRVLLYSEAHNNTGEWNRSSEENREALQARIVNSVEYQYKEAVNQLIPYSRAARYLVFQDQLTNMDRRAYLVELVDRLVLEVAEAERRGEVPLMPRPFQTARFEGQKVLPATLVMSGRSQLLSGYRKMRI